MCECGAVGMAVIGAIGCVSVGHVGMTVSCNWICE